MRISTVTLISTFLSTTIALPTLHERSTNPTNFYLVTTTSCERAANSSWLENVSATSLFDPYDQATFLLRLIEPGYGSLPKFNLSQAILHSFADPPASFTPAKYNSTRVVAGAKLGFDDAPESNGNLGLEQGFLLTVGGVSEGWTICEGPLEESVVSF